MEKILVAIESKMELSSWCTIVVYEEIFTSSSNKHQWLTYYICSLGISEPALSLSTYVLKCSVCFFTGIVLVITLVNSSNPDPADANDTPLPNSCFDSNKFGSKKGGMVSLIPRPDAMKSEINFPSENLPVDILPGKDCP